MKMPLETRAPSSRPRVTIVMPVYGRADLTEGCLVSLSRTYDKDPSYELIVVDNGSPDATARLLELRAGFPPYPRTLRNVKNLGFARACNQGAAVAAGEFLLFLNNDTEVREEWLAPLLRTLESDPAVASAGSKLLYPQGTIQHAGVLLAEIEEGDPLRAVHVYSGEPSGLAAANMPRSYQALSAACLLVRRSAFESVGGFDEGYWNGYEDIDLCLRFGEKGWLNIYQPESTVIHYESESGPERFAKVRENIERLHRRWLGKVAADVKVDVAGVCLDSGAGKVRSYRPAGVRAAPGLFVSERSTTSSGERSSSR